MSLFKDSPVKIVIAIILVGVWGVLKYQRMHEYDDPIRPAQAPPAAPAPAEPPKLVVGAEASVIATIDWADPADPRAVPLWSGDYLFDTHAGIQVWNSGTLALTPLKALPASARLLEQAWMRYSGPKARGTLFAVQDASLASVVLVKDQQSTVDQRVLLPVGFTPDAMVKLTDYTALLCSANAGHSLVVDGRTGELKLMTQADSPDQKLPMTERGVAVVGPVSGFPDQQAAPLADDGKFRQPLWFDTRSCRWQANGLPEPLASAQDLMLSVRPDVRLDNAGIAIVAASWRDPLTRELKTLQTPLVWNRDHLQWWQRKTADLPGVGPGAMVGLQELDWSYAAAEGRFAFHGSVDDQWREATQRLPAHDSFKLLYSGNEGVFVLLASKLQPGRIVHLDPASRFSAARTSLSGESVVAFGRGALMVLESAGAKVNLITPDAPKPAPVAALPQAQRNSAGVELADGSILVFGGLAPGCEPNGPGMCPQRSAGALRWIPLEQRWQSVPGLAVPYASGESLEGGGTELNMHYGRSDFLVRGKELFYLSNNAIKWTGYPRDEASRLYRWQLAGNSEALAQTRLNRRNASLIALDDGRLAVAGGAAVEGGDAYASTRSCEIYDAISNRWFPGPQANHAGGRAVKLDNGRIFKLALLGESPHSAVYGAETADQALSHWSAAPPFPLPQSATVKAMHVIGNQVLLVMQAPADRMVLWDDDSRSWQIRPLPRHSAWSIHTLPEFVARGAGGGLLLIFQDGFEYLDWPLH